MSTENCICGAPRIHGELLKLGIAVSERTVSRYLAHRPRGRSQTWRTFLTNHVGDVVCNSAVASSDARNNDGVIDGNGDLFPFCLTPTSGTTGCFQPHGDDRWRSFGSTPVPSLAGFLDPTLTTGRGHASSGRDPPKSLQARQNAYARRLFRPAEPLRTGTVSSDSVAHVRDWSSQDLVDRR
jgi:hypothetical protein